MTIYQKLANVQSKLKCQKSQYNSFGKYHYRSCEDILEGAKPLCIENGLVLTLTDKPLMVGTRIYIEATATVTDIADPAQTIVTTAYAREDENKKGMDDSQVTGSASSYARKYALNGLFCIDDNKDADTWNNAPQSRSNARNDNPKGNYTKTGRQAEKNASSSSQMQKNPASVDDYYQLVIDWARANEAVMFIGPLLKAKFNKGHFKELSLAEAKAFYENVGKLVDAAKAKDDAALMEDV